MPNTASLGEVDTIFLRMAKTLHQGVEVGFPYGKVGGTTFRIAEDEKDPSDNA